MFFHVTFKMSLSKLPRYLNVTIFRSSLMKRGELNDSETSYASTPN